MTLPFHAFLTKKDSITNANVATTRSALVPCAPLLSQALRLCFYGQAGYERESFKQAQGRFLERCVTSTISM